MMDWKSALASMAQENNFPEGEPETQQTEQPGNKKTAHPPLHVLLDKKGRKGKVATIIEGFELDDDEVAEIASELKRKIGTGGSTRGGEILLQGDWRDKVKSLLADRFTVKG